ncbi:peptidoglycan DD-metalloendopeptidase family protein [Clostridium sp. DL1XJH146]
MNNLIKKIKKWQEKLTLNFKESKKIKFSAITTVSLILIALIIYNNSITYAVIINNNTIGFVKNKDEISELKNNLKLEYELKLNKEIEIAQKISFDKTLSYGKNVLTTEEIKPLIINELNINVEAYTIYADSKELAVLNSEETANSLLENLKNQYIDEDYENTLKETHFVETVEVKKEYCNPEEITNLDTAFQLIALGTDEIKEYIVEEGDVVSCIAEDYNISVNEVCMANPTIDIDKIQIGQVLSLTVPKPFINVETIESADYIEEIPFETEYKSSDDIYEGDTKVSVKGVCGSANIKADIVKVNGIETERIILEKQNISEPTTEIVLKGTKTRPKTVAYGSFIKPTTGYITSPFGYRWGRMHEGVDFGIPTGSPIIAADGGKVTYAGWKGGYGYLVIIDHENGYQTYYGHNSSLKVCAGERVYRGQTISLSGNTGNSTGPHLHFEIRKNGTPVNPLNYI